MCFPSVAVTEGLNLSMYCIFVMQKGCYKGKEHGSLLPHKINDTVQAGGKGQRGQYSPK